MQQINIFQWNSAHYETRNVCFLQYVSWNLLIVLREEMLCNFGCCCYVFHWFKWKEYNKLFEICFPNVHWAANMLHAICFIGVPRALHSMCFVHPFHSGIPFLCKFLSLCALAFQSWSVHIYIQLLNFNCGCCVAPQSIFHRLFWEYSSYGLDLLLCIWRFDSHHLQWCASHACGD